MTLSYGLRPETKSTSLAEPNAYGVDFSTPSTKGVIPIGHTSNEVKDRWKAANYTRLTIYLPKEEAASYKAKCDAQGKTMSDVPKEAIYKFLRDE